MSYVNEEGLSRYSSLVKKDLKTKANIDSPILTGIPEAPTPGSSATSTQIATVGYIDKSIDNVNTAVEKAQSTADSAASAAKNAQTAAESAQSTANDAVNTAESASDKSETAVETANEALYIAQTAANGDYAPTNHASQSTKYGLASGSLFGHVMLVDYATDSYGVDSGVAVTPSALFDINTNASEAKTTADQALQDSETALTVSNVNTESIVTINDDIANVKQYESVGEVDLNDYYYEFAKIYVTSGSSNLPSSTESFFVDVNVDSDTSIVRQFATGAATGGIYLRMGTLTAENDVVLDKTNGTVVVNGDLSANIYVNGNVKVSGKISGIVNASGSISYGSLTGTANANVDITVGDCNIQVGGGNLTFDSDLTYNSDEYSEDDYGDLYTEGTVTNASGVTTILYCNLTIETDSEYGFYNAGNITVDDSGSIDSTTENTIGYGVYNNDGSTFVVNGRVDGYAPEDSYAVYGTFTGTGEVYANDYEYYDGDNDNDEPDDDEPDGDSGYVVEWGNWISISTGDGGGGSSLTGTAGSGTNFIWLDNGTLKATTETVGSENTPVYLNNGEVQSTDHSFDEYMPINGGTFTGGIFGNVVDVESGEIDLLKGNMFNLNLTDDIELSFVNIPGNVATSFSLIVTGESEVTWTDNIVWNGKVEPVFKKDYTTVLTFLTANGGESWFGYVSIKDEEIESELSGTVGSETQPIYLDDGKLKETSTSLEDYMPLSGGTITGDVTIANGVNVTSAEDSEGVVINGLIITSNGHIKLASGIEFY